MLFRSVVDDYALVQIAFQEWSTGMTDITVLGMNVKDADGNMLISYDANGNITYNVADAAADTPVADEPASDAATTAPAADKGSPDTGIEGIAAVAGVAVVAAGAVALSRKRK